MGEMLGILGLVVGLGGLLASLYFYRRTRQLRRLSWAYRSLSVLSPGVKVSELSIEYRGSGVDSLATTDVLFWNSGDVEIDRVQHMASNDPIRFLSTHAPILDCRVVEARCASGDLRFEVDQTRYSVAIEFGFLNPGDGARLRLLHAEAPDPPVELVGVLKGVTANQAIRRTSYQAQSQPPSADQVKNVGCVVLVIPVLATIIVGLVVGIVGAIQRIGEDVGSFLQTGYVPREDLQNAESAVVGLVLLVALAALIRITDAIALRLSPTVWRLQRSVRRQVIRQPDWIEDQSE